MVVLYLSVAFILLIGVLVPTYYSKTNKRHTERRETALEFINKSITKI